MNFAFQNLRLDTVNQCVWRGEARLSLTPKAFDVLRYLVEHSGRLVTHDELLEALWPETYVQPEVLRKYILEIRKALRDRLAEPLFVRTLPKRGYEFVASVTSEHSITQAQATAKLPMILVGRKDAFAQLAKRFRESQQGNRQIVFVTGEAGIGKTTLVEAFQHRMAEQHNVRILHGQCVEGFGGKEAYYPLLEALGRLLRGPEAEPAIKVLAKRAPTWLIQFPSSITMEQRQVLQRDIFGATRERMVREICEALESLATEHSLVVTLEDLHWVDRSTLDVISALARRREACKLLLIGTYRPVDVILSASPLKVLKQDLLVHQLCDELALERFGDAEISEYLAAKLPESRLPRALVDLVYRHSDGNALFMVAIIEDLLKKGMISGGPGNWQLSQPLEHIHLELPATLREMFEVLFEQLNAEERKILKAASVVGDRFSAWAVGAALDIDAAQAEEICESLAKRKNFIIDEDTDEAPDVLLAGEYAFKHTLYRDFLYKELPITKRCSLHRNLADRMEALFSPPPPSAAAELALHFEEGRDYVRAIHYLLVAAENAERRHAPKDTIQILQHARDLLPNAPTESRTQFELEIMKRIAGAHYALGEMLESADVYARIAVRAAELGIATMQITALIREASSASFVNPDRCIATCERAVEASVGIGAPELEACAQLLAPSWRLVFNGWKKEDADQCAAAMEKLRLLNEQPRSVEDRIQYGQILYAQIQCMQGDHRGALENLEAWLPRLVDTQNTWEYLSSHMARAVAYMGLGRLGDAHRTLRNGMEAAENAGNAPWVRGIRGALAHLKYLAFDFEGALRESEELLDAGWMAPGQAWSLLTITAGLSELELGRPAQALRNFEKAQDDPARPRRFLDWYWRLLGLFGSSRAWLATRSLANACRDAELFLRGAQSCADRSLESLAWALKAELADAQQDWREARANCEKALAAMKDPEVPIFAWRVHAIVADSHCRSKDEKAAEQERRRARNLIVGLAESFEEGEPLRASILKATYLGQTVDDLSESKPAQGSDRNRLKKSSNAG
jgi:DNA-binding winged helix-turn-helix (wHTH) protein/tetratricopeptide (TPR) repeat protein